jgi:subtilisin family serine protease
VKQNSTMVSLDISRKPTMPVWLLLPVLCLCQLLLAGCTSDGPKTFIVQVDSNSKPAVFPTPEQWYTSIVASVKAAVKTESGSFMDAQHDDALLLYVYRTVLQGFSAMLMELEAAEMQRTPGVLAIFPDRVLQLHTTRTPHFLGLETPNASHLWAESNYGSNVVIGLIDTGVWPERRSFRDHNMGPVPMHWKGECESGVRFSKSNCNKKLVGARSFYKGYEAAVGPLNETVEFRSARDSEGHGTHTASTAAGDFVGKANLMGYAPGVAKGMAPKARIAVYKACWYSGCANSDLLSAFDKALEDGVDVISLSVGSDARPYVNDTIAIGAFEAARRGVFVSASAGNSGPGNYTVSNVAPWITTVGAGSLDRNFTADVHLGNGIVIPGVSLYSGKGLSSRYLVPLVYGGNASRTNDSSLAPYCIPGSLDPKVVKGKIVLCENGNGGVQEGIVVRKAGGVGMIVNGDGFVGEAYTLPASNVNQSAGALILQYIQSTKNPTATITFRGTQLGVQPAPKVAFFSSRGPNYITPEILKPDLIAPGLNILAAWTGATREERRRTEFNIISGTSMSCPHVSGIAALLKAVHPEWSPAAIKSALMTTAYTHDLRIQETILDEATGMSSTPFVFGAGHVDPERAADPGLIYDLGVNDYVAFLCTINYTAQAIRIITNTNVTCPARGGQLGNFNYPAFSSVFNLNRSSALSTSFSRTVTNVGPPVSTYRATVIAPVGAVVTVKPRILRFTKKDEKLSFVLNVKAMSLNIQQGAPVSTHGLLSWSDGQHVVQSPILVTVENIPSK